MYTGLTTKGWHWTHEEITSRSQSEKTVPCILGEEVKVAASDQILPSGLSLLTGRGMTYT